MRVEENFALMIAWSSKPEVQFNKLEDVMPFCFDFTVYSIYLQPVFGKKKCTIFSDNFFVIQDSTNSVLVQNAHKNLDFIFVQIQGSRDNNNDKMYELGMEKTMHRTIRLPAYKMNSLWWSLDIHIIRKAERGHYCSFLSSPIFFYL